VIGGPHRSWEMSIEIRDAGITLKSNTADFETDYQKFILKKVIEDHKLNKAERIIKMGMTVGTFVFLIVLISLHSAGKLPSLSNILNAYTIGASGLTTGIVAFAKHLLSKNKE
jgi:hypothetical protein